MFNFKTVENESIVRHSDAREKIASLTSNILNPFLISLAVILIFSFSSAGSTTEAVKWSLISASVSILPIFLVIIYLIHTGGLEAIFDNARRQRTKIYMAAGLSAVMGYFTLSYLKAPEILLAGFTSLLLVAVIFMLINLRWKISVHTGCVAASSMVLVMLFGWEGAATVPLVPLTAWARVKLERHSLAQAVVGAILAAAIAVVIFYPITRR